MPGAGGARQGLPCLARVSALEEDPCLGDEVGSPVLPPQAVRASLQQLGGGQAAAGQGSPGLLGPRQLAGEDCETIDLLGVEGAIAVEAEVQRPGQPALEVRGSPAGGGGGGQQVQAAAHQRHEAGVARRAAENVQEDLAGSGGVPGAEPRFGLVQLAGEVLEQRTDPAPASLPVIVPAPSRGQEIEQLRPGVRIRGDHREGLLAVRGHGEPGADQALEGGGVLEGASEEAQGQLPLGGGQRRPELEIRRDQEPRRFRLARCQHPGVGQGAVPGGGVGEQAPVVVHGPPQIGGRPEEHGSLPGGRPRREGPGREPASELQALQARLPIEVRISERQGGHLAGIELGGYQKPGDSEPRAVRVRLVGDALRRLRGERGRGVAVEAGEQLGPLSRELALLGQSRDGESHREGHQQALPGRRAHRVGERGKHGWL